MASRETLPLKFTSCLSVDLNCKSNLPPELTGLLRKWQIEELYITNNVLVDEEFQQAFKNGLLDNFATHFQFQMDIKSYLSDHPDLAEQILRQQLFSGSEYFVRQKSWGSDIFHFSSLKTEIIPLNARRKKLVIKNPEHVYRLFFTPVIPTQLNQPGPAQALQLVDVTDDYNEEKQRIIPRDEDGFIIVVRQFHLQYGDDLKKRFNIFELGHMERVLKIFQTRIKKRLGSDQHLFFDFDTIFAPSADARLIDFHERLMAYNPYFFEQVFRHWMEPTTLFSGYYRAFNQFFQRELKPILDNNGLKVQYRISLTNPFVSSLWLDSSILLELDEHLFEPGTPYYDNALTQIKRSVSRRTIEGENKMPVVMHHLLNLQFAFNEKLRHINHLLAYGVNHFVLHYDLPDELTKQLPATDPGYTAYEQWFSRLNQVGHFFKEGFPVTELLVLYPGFDENLDMFNRAMHQVRSTGMDYTLVDFDLFTNPGYCTVSDKQITFGQQKFKIVLLPAIRILPMNVLNKLAAFLEQGGIIVAIGRVPERCAEGEVEHEFMRTNHNIWFKGNRTRSTSFKENPNGGISYFQADSSQLNSLLQNFNEYFRIQITASQPGVRYRLREHPAHYNLFLTNLNEQEEIEIEIRTALQGKPYIWDFSEAEIKPFSTWHLKGRYLHMKMCLAPGAGEMILLNRAELPEGWQVVESKLNGLELRETETGGFVLSGYQRDPGRHYSVLQKDEQKKRVAVSITGKLPILSISSRNWFMESNTFSGIVDLGNYARFYPYQSGQLTYNKIIIIEPLYLKNQYLKLCLGQLRDWCTLYINEQLVGHRFESPWEFDISPYLRAGENKLTIRVSNTLSNIMARDDDRYLVRDFGLFGPIKIIPHTRFQYDSEKAD